MEPASPAPFVLPNPRIPKVLGILNIVFASALMICGLCTLGSFVAAPAMSKAMVQLQKDIQTKQDARRQATLDGFDAEEKAATTDEAKAEVAERRKRFEAQPAPPKMPQMDFDVIGLSEWTIRAYIWLEFLTGLVLNLLMMTAGIGLVMRKGWSIRLGLSVAALKIVRLVLVYGYAAVVIVPKVAVGMTKFQMQSMAQQLPPGQQMPPNFADTITKITVIWYTSCAVLMIVVGSIYPLISLWLLSRPSARAACSELVKSREPADSW